MRFFRARFALPLIALGILAGVALWPSPVEAQCGTQASSCKNCHEVQGQDPVNTQGDWHVDHAFGDFCEFCHAGNVTAAEQDAAHAGLIYPLSDPAGSCASCHPSDYEGLAVAYADTLGVDLDTMAAGPSGEGDSAPPAESESSPSENPSGEADEPAGEPVQTGGAVIDLNSRYESARPRQAVSLNVGNIILTIMLFGLLGVFGALAWRFEGLGEKWAELRGRLPASAQSASYAGVEAAGAAAHSPTLRELLPALEKASPATLAALSRILESDPARGGQMIEALARLDPRLIEVVRRLDDEDLELLVALVRELKQRA